MNLRLRSLGVRTGDRFEGICRHFETKSENLFKGLKELLDQNVIDKMLHDWGQELRTHRNLAAHATGTKFTRIDAEDIFDFAKTICEYVFVLTRGVWVWPLESPADSRAYQLFEGHHRYHASVALGLTDIPALVIPRDKPYASPPPFPCGCGGTDSSCPACSGTGMIEWP